MNKDIKLLVESFFDDIEDDILDIDSLLEDNNNKFRLSSMSLFDCKSAQLIRDVYNAKLKEADPILVKHNAYNYNTIIEKADLIYNEMSYIPKKQYVISEKDISRMNTCFSSLRWNGFTAITKIDKLIPRFTAGIIAGGGERYLKKFDEDNLYAYIAAYQPYTKLFRYVNLALRDLIHFKDLVNTYNNTYNK